MKKHNQKYSFNTPSKCIGGIILLSLLTVMCRNVEKQNKIERLDNQIADVTNKIKQTQNMRNAPVPNNLRGTQNRYNKTMDSLNDNADSVDLCVAYNDSLITNAFNKYAIRIGHDFQLSKFLSMNDINVFQKQIATLDTMDFIQESARQRILNGYGSLNDLSYFLEIIDFDSVNNLLFNKLAWNFDSDTNTNDADMEIIPVLNFDTTCANGMAINNAMHHEQKLLNMVWTYSNAKASDSMIHNTIPEFDSLYKNKEYQYNDSLVRAHDSAFQRAMRAEDSLADYENMLRWQRDSLQRERNELEK